MKVLQVLNHFLPQQTAGTEVYTWALSKQLQQRNIEVEIAIPNYGKSVSNEYVYNGLKVFQYAEPSKVDRSLIMGFREPEGLAFFKEHIRKSAPDIIHFHELAGSNGIGLPHIIAAKEFGAKIIFTFHLAGYSCSTGNLITEDGLLCDGAINLRKCSSCYLNNKSKGRYSSLLLSFSHFLHSLNINSTTWKNKIGTALGTVSIIQKRADDLDLLVSHCDKVVVLAQWYKKILLLNNVDASKMRYVAQGLPSKADTNPINPDHNDGVLRLVFLGRISRFKGLHLLLSAIKPFPIGNISLDIYGETDDLAYENESKQIIKDNSNIHWKGKLKQENVVSVLRQYDALCLCSTFSEMSPLVIQEAFAAGIPVIASKVHGNAEQIRHEKDGLLFDFNSSSSLREQISRCVNDKYLLRAMKNNIRHPRSFEDVAEDYISIYKEVF